MSRTTEGSSMSRPMRATIATALIRLAVRILAGHDDRRVFLNTPRRRSRVTGRVYPFVGYGTERRAIAVVPDDVRGLSTLGTSVPAMVARLAGWDLYGKGEAVDKPPNPTLAGGR